MASKLLKFAVGTLFLAGTFAVYQMYCALKKKENAKPVCRYVFIKALLIAEEQVIEEIGRANNVVITVARNEDGDAKVSISGVVDDVLHAKTAINALKTSQVTRTVLVAPNLAKRVFGNEEYYIELIRNTVKIQIKVEKLKKGMYPVVLTGRKQQIETAVNMMHNIAGTDD